MHDVAYNTILNRLSHEKSLKQTLIDFELNKHNCLYKRGIYVYGESGTGKTHFVTEILKDMNYDIIHYNTGDVRNKVAIENLSKNNTSEQNIISIFNRTNRKNAIIMDEIDGMNSGDKGGINALIKMLRPKKTKKQKTEDTSIIPIICINNFHNDKKITELKNICVCIELPKIQESQIANLVRHTIPDKTSEEYETYVRFIQRDLYKLHILLDIYTKTSPKLYSQIIYNILNLKNYSDEPKEFIQKMYMSETNIDNEESYSINEADRTIVGLLWHENIINLLEPLDKKLTIPLYIEILNNTCMADYVDRFTFQKQIWQLNELSSIIKTMKNNKLYTNFKQQYNIKPHNIPVSSIRFTQVLTKYSTEFSNYTFIQRVCAQLGLDTKDVIMVFLKLQELDNQEITNRMIEKYSLTKLDISRIYRFIQKYIADIPTTSNIIDDYDLEPDNEDVIGM